MTRYVKQCVMICGVVSLAWMGCEPKKETSPSSTKEDTGATATAPAVDAGSMVGEADKGGSVAEAQDMEVDAGAGSEQPLKLELDRNLFSPSKSGVMPNLRFDDGDKPLHLQLGAGKGSAPKQE